MGGRAFSVAGLRVGLWNSLPDYVTWAETLIAFRRGLKTFLFQQSYYSQYVVLAVA